MIVKLLSLLQASVLLTACTPAMGQQLERMVPSTSATSASPAAEMQPALTASFETGVIELPAPQSEGESSLEEVLAQRRSVREFSEETLSWGEVGQLLWAAQGITDPKGHRTATSAGALYPLEVILATQEGAFHYVPQDHQLVVQIEGDIRPELYSAAVDQEAILDAPAVIVIAAVYERTARKYGAERGPRYVHLEAGHAAQNILLQAVAMGLGAVTIGAFMDGEVIDALSLPPDWQPIYLIPVGHPRQGSMR